MTIVSAHIILPAGWPEFNNNFKRENGLWSSKSKALMMQQRSLFVLILLGICVLVIAYFYMHNMRQLNPLRQMDPLFTQLQIAQQTNANQQKSSTVTLSLSQAMQRLHVPVVSYAIIENNRIVDARIYSNDSTSPKAALSTSTRFQAGSISKSIAAVLMLQLVQAGKMHLDVPINDGLTSWQLPPSVYTKKRKPLLKDVMSMTGGIGVMDFDGYAPGVSLPSLVQILNGMPPANSPPITVFATPRTQYFYSGGGYTIIEQSIEDLSHQNFAVLAKQKIFDPIHMSYSAFYHELPKNWSQLAVPGHLAAGAMLPGYWHIYPEFAAAGLWSTPTDIAKFAIALMQSYQERNHVLLNPTITKKMFQKQNGFNYGLGFYIDQTDHALIVSKGGATHGYRCMLIFFPRRGQGAVIMTNADNGVSLIRPMLHAIAQHNHWPSYQHLDPLT